MNNHTNAPLPISLLLSGDVIAQLADSLNAAVDKGGNRFVGVWCRETCFACLVEVWADAQLRWHFTGPLTQLQAREWIGVNSAASTITH